MTSFDISETLEPNSEQLDAVELLGGARTFSIERVTKGNAEQPVQVHLAEFPRPWRPGKSMRRVLAACWGADASQWVGRRVRLYCDLNVVFGKEKVGGTRIAALSHIDKPRQIPLLVSKGRSAVFTVEPLADDAPPTAPAGSDLNAAKQRVWQAHKATQPDLSDTDRKVEVAQLIAEQGLDPNSAADMDKLVGVINGD